MKYTILLLCTLLMGLQQINAQNYFWIGFTDKNNSEYSLDNPSVYLSERAIERRINQNIPIDSLDLPVNQNYIDSVLTLNVELVHASKWLNGITVSCDSTNLADSLTWDFIREVQLTKPGTATKSTFNKFEDESFADVAPIDTSLYGSSVYQVGMMEGQFLHNENFRGQGKQIAVLDAGFLKVDELPAFDSLWANNQILGTKDFVNPDDDFFSTNYHGMSVLSCMGGNIPGELIGTAPKASYWLLRSEDTGSEYKIEEDNWVAAAEFADSVGVDIINSSLGYTEFQDTATNHTYSDMDGKTTRVTRGANIAASRGIMVFSSAGNERANSWFRIVAPSDGVNVIGVGAVDKNFNPAYFSSAGPAADGALKPNVSAMGYQTTVQRSNGSLSVASGTSFSSPVLAGMAASLWQCYSNKTAVEIKDALEKSGHLYSSPDSLQGYGVPNMRQACALLNPVSTPIILQKNIWTVFPNPVQDRIVVQSDTNQQEHEIDIEIYSIDGSKIKAWKRSVAPSISLNGLETMEPGIYLLVLRTKEGAETFKINKIR
ncbi:S8 family serine peptidase [Draconibacterium sp. IB214405]|uniref:S8 family serine peptidase n=1 Tax=Draconibacterium sp. IB214405 TaxID=3097352 RepID=UPI002A0D854B|nr:S8 family serine peptidase [Draconibacterium sp. IB214405]MDX8340670.1 S8 family serine peptidase [Draconibacterium sp. IB214405]